MHDTTTAAPPRQGVRVQSIDLLRGLDVLLMLFVNDLAGVPGAPAFLKHVPASVDGMTITDVVFPAFLFITGMSIPLALDGRLQRGATRLAVWRHVLARALSLLVIGVFMVNGEYATPGGLLSPALWIVLMTIAVVLVWRVPDATRGSRATRSPATAPTSGGRVSLSTIVGVLALIGLAIVYHSGETPSLGDFRTHWWGILGLIGWAYLPAATLYLLATPTDAARGASDGVRGERGTHQSWRTLAILATAAVLFYASSILGRMGLLTWLGPAQSYVSVALGTQTAVALCGVILTVLLQRHIDRRDPRGEPTGPSDSVETPESSEAVASIEPVNPVGRVATVGRAGPVEALGRVERVEPIASSTPVAPIADAQARRRTFVPIALGYAAALGGASLLLHAFSDQHPAFWFSKLQGSAPWGLASAALTAAAWTALFILVDIRGWRRWPSIVPIAGELALLIYLAAPFVLSLFTLTTRLTGVDFYRALAQPTPLGFARALLFAWALVSLCGWLRTRGLRVRL